MFSYIPWNRSFHILKKNHSSKSNQSSFALRLKVEYTNQENRKDLFCQDWQNCLELISLDYYILSPVGW